MELDWGLKVFGESIETDITPTPQPQVAGSQQVSPKPLIITMLLVSMGLALLAGVLVWQKRSMLKDKEA